MLLDKILPKVLKSRSTYKDPKQFLRHVTKHVSPEEKIAKNQKDLERRISRTFPVLSQPFNKLNRKVVQLLIFKDKSKKTTSNCGSGTRV